MSEFTVRQRLDRRRRNLLRLLWRFALGISRCQNVSPYLSFRGTIPCSPYIRLASLNVGHVDYLTCRSSLTYDAAGPSMPTLRIEFYRPSLLNAAGVSFSDVCNQVMALPRPWIRQGDDPVALLTLERHGEEYMGEAARVRMVDLPSVINVTTCDRHDLNVRNQEGLGEEIHYLYDAAINIIAVQSKLHLRASALQQLFSELSDRNVDFQIVLRADALQRFEDMDLITKINFKLARPNDIEGRPRPAVTRIFREIEEFNGVAARVEITVGRQRRTLSLAAIRQLIRDFTLGREDFKALSLTGLSQHGDARGNGPQLETVDFIKERMIVLANVQRIGRGRRLNAEDCRLALRRAIREHREYLRRYRD
jgi:hypothetical protein